LRQPAEQIDTTIRHGATTIITMIYKNIIPFRKAVAFPKPAYIPGLLLIRRQRFYIANLSLIILLSLVTALV
jgi:hypothetical protein